MVTYGDGVCDVDLAALLAFHRAHGRIATVTAVRPPARFGGLVFDGDLVTEFTEKPQIGEGWINGGFFVFEPALFDYLDGRRDEPRGRRARAAGRGRTAGRVPARRLLAVHGHAARQAAARGALADGRRAVEGRREPRSGGTGRPSSPARRASSAAGRPAAARRGRGASCASFATGFPSASSSAAA